MAQDVLVAEQIEAGERLIHEFSKTIPVQAAFWGRQRESAEWCFYLASDQINDNNFDVAYGEALRLIPPDDRRWIGPFQIKVIGSDAPIAKAAIDVLKRFPITAPTRYHGRQLGDAYIDEVYLYPLPLALSV